MFEQPATCPIGGNQDISILQSRQEDVLLFPHPQRQMGEGMKVMSLISDHGQLWLSEITVVGCRSPTIANKIAILLQLKSVACGTCLTWPNSRTSPCQEDAVYCSPGNALYVASLHWAEVCSPNLDVFFLILQQKGSALTLSSSLIVQFWKYQIQIRFHPQTYWWFFPPVTTPH